LGDEQFFLDQGYQLIIPSRPGYGKTPSTTGKTAEAFADALVSLLDLLHLDQVIVVGISAAGPTALQLAGRAPERVSKLILESAHTGSTFATGRTRLLTYIFFNPVVERWFWAAYRAYGHRAPQAALKMMMKSLSSLPIDQVMASMTQQQQQAALALLLASRSGSGFLHDIRHHCGDLSRITAPTLIIHSQYDGAVGLSHATWAYERIPHAELFVSKAESHLLWFSAAYEETKVKMRAFLQS
jgi:pimeloyl-ACP methyl ester carboxylesterase